MTLEEPMYIHPSSVLYHMNKEFIVYQSVEEMSSRIYMKGNTEHLSCFAVYCYLNDELLIFLLLPSAKWFLFLLPDVTIAVSQ